MSWLEASDGAKRRRHSDRSASAAFRSEVDRRAHHAAAGTPHSPRRVTSLSIDEVVARIISPAEAPLLTKDTLFKPSPQESRAGETDRIARGLIEDETNLRLAKQHRLRAARLEQEAAIAATVQDDPPGKAARRKRTKPRTPHS